MMDYGKTLIYAHVKDREKPPADQAGGLKGRNVFIIV